jgi:hypothetical protein
MLSVVGAIAVAADTYREASSKPVPISGAQATANAMKALPNNGAGFTVVALQLEPSSEHFCRTQWTIWRRSGEGMPRRSSAAAVAIYLAV